MPRIEVELTSCREDGEWTWRAAGAREPRGILSGELLSKDATPGDVVTVEATQDIDGILVTSVLPNKESRQEPELLQIIGSGTKAPEVTTNLKKGKQSRKSREKRSHKESDRNFKKDNNKNRKSKDRKKPNKESMSHSSRKATAFRNEEESKKAKHLQKNRPPRRKTRLKAKRNHRKEAISQLPEEQRRLGELLLQSGVPGLRSAIKEQNLIAREKSEPEIPEDILLDFAEKINPGLRAADWLDKAEAAIIGIDKVDLRDLRSVVVASESSARSNEARDLAEKLKEGLGTRLAKEHEKWINEIEKAITEGRTVRALRLSSRPPKAGAPLPEPILARLTDIANSGLSPEVNQGRWATLIEAIVVSPVRVRVKPQGIPKNPGNELTKIVQRFASQVPQIASLFDLQPTTPKKSQKPKTKS